MTQTVEFMAEPGLTLTATLFAVNSDVVVQSASASQSANRKVMYSAEFTNVPAGTYFLVAYEFGDPAASWYVALEAADGTYRAGSYTDVAGVNTLSSVEALLRNKTVTNPVTGVMTVYAEDGTTPLYQADIYQDHNGYQKYKGSGIERRERLE